MKKLLVAAVALLCASTILVQAQDTAPKKEKKVLTAEQKALWKEIVTKYDTNKDGKLDKTERAVISQEDKDKLEKAGIGLTHAKKKAGEAKAEVAATPAMPATK